MRKITLFIVLITIAFIIFIFSGLGIDEKRVQQLEAQNNGLSSEALFVIPLAYASSNNDDEDDEDEKDMTKKENISTIGMAQNLLMMKWLKEIKNV